MDERWPDPPSAAGTNEDVAPTVQQDRGSVDEPAAPPDGSAAGPGQPAEHHGRSAAGPSQTVGRRDRAVAWGIVTVCFVAVVASMVANGADLHRSELATSWQLDDLANLEANPFSSTWYRHVQPPLFNLLVGLVAWSPLPLVGTVQAVFLAGLWGIGVLVAELLLRWRVGPWAAGLIAALTLTDPMLLSSIVNLSYEVPVLVLICASLLQLRRHLDHATGRNLVLLSVLLTSASMMRSLLHPVWIVAVLVIALLARPVGRRAAVVALAIPLVVVGGWTAKNAVLFDTASTSSWFGFNLQRGIVAPMAASDVEADIADGSVSELARLQPWLPLDAYAAWTAGCAPDHRHPSLDRPARAEGGGNFNHVCYLPVYARAEQDARVLLERHPGRYLSTRWATFPYAFGVSPLGDDDPPPDAFGPPPPTRTWMDAAADRWLLPVDAHLDMRDWNLPFFGLGELPYRLSLTLLAATLALWARGTLAAARLARRFRTERATTWDADEVLWLVAALTVALSIVVGTLIEFGENQRFRTAVDPLVIALPAAALVRAVQRLRARRGDLAPPADAVIAS